MIVGKGVDRTAGASVAFYQGTATHNQSFGTTLTPKMLKFAAPDCPFVSGRDPILQGLDAFSGAAQPATAPGLPVDSSYLR